MAPVIQPITDADRLLKQLTNQASAVTSITAALTFELYTVPLGKRWTVFMARARRSSGVWGFDSYGFKDPAGVAMPVEEFASTTTDHLWQLAVPIPLDEGWKVTVNVDTWTSIGDMNMNMLVEEEDAF